MLDPRCELPLAEPIAGAVRLAVLLAAIATGPAVTPAGAQTVGPAELVPPSDLAYKVTVESVTEGGGTVTGEVVNNSDRPLRDVKLRVEYYWLWRDEHRLGADDPSFSVTEVLSEEVPPRARQRFSYSFPAARTDRTDGQWVVTVRVIGYSTATKIIERTLVQ